MVFMMIVVLDFLTCPRSGEQNSEVEADPTLENMFVPSKFSPDEQGKFFGMYGSGKVIGIYLHKIIAACGINCMPTP